MQSLIYRNFWVIFVIYPFNCILGQEFTKIEQEVIGIIDSSRTLYSEHNYTAAIKMIEAVDLVALNNDSLTLELFYRASVSHQHLDNYSKKFEYAVRGLEIAKKIDEKWMIASLYRQVGSVMDYPIGDTEGALKYLKKANQYSEALDSLSQCGLLLDIGQTSGSASQHDSAEYYFHKAFNHMTADSTMWFDACNFYTGYLVYNEFYEKAEPYVKYVYDESEKMGFINGRIGAEINMAWIEHKRNNNVKALAYADEALQKAENIGSIYSKVNALEIRSEIMKVHGTKDEQINSLQEFIKSEQALEKEYGSDSLLQLRVKFETQEYQSLLANLADSNQALQNTSSNSKMLASTLGFALLGFGLYSLIRTKKRKAHIAELQRQFEATKEERIRLQEEYQKAVDLLQEALVIGEEVGDARRAPLWQSNLDEAQAKLNQ